MQSQQCWQLSRSLTAGEAGARPSTQLFGNKVQETAFVIKGVPRHLTQWQLLDLLGGCLEPHQKLSFNFFYCPWNHEEGCNGGSAVINFTSKDHAVMFKRKLGAMELLGSTEPLSLRLSAVQGLRANINYYRKTAVNNSSRDCPIYRDELGCLLPFCRDATTSPSSLEQPEEEPLAPIQEFISFEELALLAMLGRDAICKRQW